MNNNLQLFITITQHLEYLTTRDEHNSRRSKGIGTKEELATELNEVGIVPKRGYWTTHSLECFIDRMKKQYGTAELKRLSDLRFINAQNWEITSATNEWEVRVPQKQKPYWRVGKITVCDDSYGRSFRTSQNDLWKNHEGLEMWIDEKKKISE